MARGVSEKARKIDGEGRANHPALFVPFECRSVCSSIREECSGSLRPALPLQDLRLGAAFLPLVVEDAGLVGAVIEVAAEEVALALDEVPGEAAAAVGVVVGEAGAERRGGDALLDAGRDDAAPRRLVLADRVP